MKTYKFEEGLEQDYGNYKDEAFSVWRILFERQIENLSDVACTEFLDGIKNVNFHSNKIPDFNEVNTLLQNSTGWKIIAVHGIIEEKIFFKMLSEKQLPATTWLRKMSELDYLSEPDMFHDVFGHVPLLSNQLFCDFHQKLGEIGVQHLENDEAIEMLGRIYWFTVEFGLIQEGGKQKFSAQVFYHPVGKQNFH